MMRPHSIRPFRTCLVAVMLGVAACSAPAPPPDRVEARASASHALDDTAGFGRTIESTAMARDSLALSDGPTGVWRIVSNLVVLLGVLKIVLSLGIFTIRLIVDSKSESERWAKMVATSLGVLVVFWIVNSIFVGFTRPIEQYLLSPASTSPIGKLLSGMLAGFLTWLSFRCLEILVISLYGHRYLQTLFAFASSACLATIAPVLLSFYSVSNVNAYHFFDVIFGVVIGGFAWIIHSLLWEDSLADNEGAKHAA